MESGGACGRVDWVVPAPDQSVSWVCGALGLRNGRGLAITELRDLAGVSVRLGIGL